MKSRVIQDDDPDGGPPRPAAPPVEAPMSGILSPIRRHPLIAFFVLAYALTWGAIPWDSFFAPGALVAALVVAFIRDGLAGLRAIGARLIRWRVSWVWYALALAVPLSVLAATIGLNLAAGAPRPDTSQFSPWYGIALAIGMNIVNPTGGPFSEEPSFRGFALPILQNGRTPLAAGAILAVLVTGWHAPLFFIDSFGLQPIEAVTTVAVTFWYVWLFNQAGGSALITLIAHATEGSVDHGPGGLWPDGADATRLIWFNCAAWILVASVLVVGHRRFWTRPAPADATEEPRTTPSAVRATVCESRTSSALYQP
jgi:membrane protease YdiL (CAAX protease family)